MCTKDLRNTICYRRFCSWTYLVCCNSRRNLSESCCANRNSTEHRYYRLCTRDWKHYDVTHRQQYISWRNDWGNPRRLAMWASTRVCVGAVASERRRNHRSMIEECYQQLSMASSAVWQRFSVDKVASRCFLQCFCMLRHCALYKTRFGTVSRLSWTWLPKPNLTAKLW